MDVVFAVNRESRTAPANIHIMQRIRAIIDFGALSPYLKHGNTTTVTNMHAFETR